MAFLYQISKDLIVLEDKTIKKSRVILSFEKI